MHHLLPVQRAASHAAGDYHSEGARRRGGSQPHPAAAAGSVPAESERDPARLGCCLESAPGGGERPLSDSDQGNFAFVSGSAPDGHSVRRIQAAAGRLTQILLLAIIRTYQIFISPALPSACRYVPTCSEYARDAIANWGAWRGSRLALRRLARCHPWGGHGFDPAPERRS